MFKRIISFFSKKKEEPEIPPICWNDDYDDPIYPFMSPFQRMRIESDIDLGYYDAYGGFRDRLQKEVEFHRSVSGNTNTFAIAETKCGPYGIIYNYFGDVIAIVREKQEKYCCAV